MVACALEGHGIETLVLDEEYCRLNPQVAFVLGGVKILAEVEQWEDAVAIVGQVYTGTLPFIGSFIATGIAGDPILGLPFGFLLKARRASNAPREDVTTPDDSAPNTA